ncbi:hypothetical protein D3260_02310 [Salinisphaera sp. Q1T1-3]|nr:hypothetical protein D3260_02310 [Salinisphaera sp. Q1T1-3]
MARWQVDDIVYRGRSLFDAYRQPMATELATINRGLSRSLGQPVVPDDPARIPWASLAIRPAHAAHDPGAVRIQRSSGYENLDDFAIRMIRDRARRAESAGHDMAATGPIFQIIRFSTPAIPD